MIVYSFISFLAFIIYLYVGIYAYRLNNKSNINIAFLWLCIGMGIWSFAYSFAYIAVDNYTFSFWNKISAFGWCTFSAIILYLVLLITESKVIEYKLSKFIIFAPAFIFLFMSIFLFSPNTTPNYLVEGFFYKGDFIYNFTYLLGSILIIYVWGKKSCKNSEKAQAIILVITSTIPFILNLITQTILPYFGLPILPNMGQIYMMITIFGVYYIIVKYGFLNIPISVVAEELFTEVMDLTFLLDSEGKIIKVSKHTEELLKYTSEEIINKPITLILKDGAIKEIYESGSWGRHVSRFQELHCYDKEGNFIPVSISCTPILDVNSSRNLGILIVGQDIRLLKELNREIEKHKETYEKLKNSEQLFKLIVEIMPFALVLTKISDNTIIYANSYAEKIFKSKRDIAIGKSVIEYYINVDDRDKIIDEIKKYDYIKDKEVLMKRINGESFWCSLSLVKTRYNDEDVLLSCVNDIDEKKRLREEIEKINGQLMARNNELIEINLMLQDKAKRDGLTNLYNHQYINKKLEIEIEKAKVQKHNLWVMMLDIDFFKKVNDNFGHQVGDVVIVCVSKTISQCIRENDIVGRYGGEEFIVILSEISVDEAFKRAEHIRSSIERYIFDIKDLKVTVSIGLSEYDGNDAKSTIKSADILLYKAKKNGRNRIEMKN